MPKKTEKPAPQSPLSRLPAVDKLLAHPRVRELSGHFPAMVVNDCRGGDLYEEGMKQYRK